MKRVVKRRKRPVEGSRGRTYTVTAVTTLPNPTIVHMACYHRLHPLGTPTELELEYVAVYGELVQAVAPTQLWHGGRIVILARNHSLRACLCCGKPARWKFVPEYEEYDDELYEKEGALCEDDLDPIIFCEDWRADG